MENNKKWKDIPMSVLQMNEGQVKGLPRNPREWTYDDVERLKASIKETPELLNARGLIVYEWKSVYVVIGGNMRYTALKDLGYETAHCYVLPDTTPVEKLKEIVVKDNGSFGDWDLDMLHIDWSDTPFEDWGINIPDFSNSVTDGDFFEGIDGGDGTIDGGMMHDDDDERAEDLVLFEVAFSADEFMFVKDRLSYAGTVSTIESGLLKLIGYGK